MQPDLSELCAAIRYQHRQRNYAMEQRKRADLALGSFLRLMLGWNRDLPKAESDAIKVKVAELIETGERIAKQEAKPEGKRKPVDISDARFTEWSPLIMATIKGRAPFDDVESATTKEMERLAMELPVWSEFGEGVRGFGARSLAVIVGEAGDLSGYPKKGHLWKRMGVAVIDGTRQGGLLKSSPKEDWIEHGYNRQRRSRMWTIGDTMSKAQIKKVKDANGEDTGERIALGPYGEAYLSRKAYERQRAEEAGLIVAPSAKIPGKRADEFMSDGHIHRRAQRYMEKRLLRDLWQAWNGRKAKVNMPEMVRQLVPTVHLIAAE